MWLRIVRSRQINRTILRDRAKPSLKHCHLVTSDNSSLELLFGGKVWFDVGCHAIHHTMNKATATVKELWTMRSTIEHATSKR